MITMGLHAIYNKNSMVSIFYTGFQARTGTWKRPGDIESIRPHLLLKRCCSFVKFHWGLLPCMPPECLLGLSLVFLVLGRICQSGEIYRIAVFWFRREFLYTFIIEIFRNFERLPYGWPDYYYNSRRFFLLLQEFVSLL